MISTLEKEITFRFLKARKKDGFLNVISIFSFIGISLGVAVLIIVMSVMNGFRTELINKIVGFNSHITVKPYEKKIEIDKTIKNKLGLISNNLIFSNTSEAIIINNDNSKGVILRGYHDNDFSKLDLRVAKILVAEKIPGKSRILKGQIDLGSEKRDVIIGGAEFFEPNEMIGKTVIVVANLETKKLAGIESNAMLLAADVNDKPYWLTVSDDVPVGTKIK